MWPYLRQVSGLLLIGSLAGIVMNTAIVLPAIALGRAIDIAIAVDGHHATRTDLGWAVVLVVAATLATALPRIGKRWWLGAARNRIRATVRADAMRGVLARPADDRRHAKSTGEVTARVIGDVEVLGTGIGEIIVETWDTLLYSAAIVVAMCVYDASLAMWALAPVPIALLLAKASGRWVTGRTLAARRANAALTTHVTEHLAGLRIIRAFGRRQAATTALAGHAQTQAAAELAATRLSAVLQPVYGTMTTAGVVAVVWLGGNRVGAGLMSVGALVAFLQLFVRFTARAPRIAVMANRVQAGRAAYTRVAPLLAPAAAGQGWSSWRAGRIPAPRTESLAAADPGCPVEVRLEDVGFTYPAGAAALHDVTLSIPAGALVAITGPVGSGKSALAALIAGLYRATSGTVCVDGRDPYRWDAKDRAVLGYLPQGHPVFSGTVSDNITLADRNHSGDRLDRAIRIAELGEDLAGWPDGTGTHLGEQGVRVSGGQRQRIALARALAASAVRPRLLVLDDPFSAVDVSTEARIIEALRLHIGPEAPAAYRATIVLCSTRLAAFPLADHIVVLDAGRIAEQGTHPQLLDAGGLYARIYTAQRRVQHHPAGAS